MKKFDYSFLDNGLLPASLINITSTIYSLKTGANIRKYEYERIFTELEKIAIVQSVKSSNAIEGIVTSDERSEIAGYRDALNEIHSHYEEIEISENTILKLHEIMMNYTGSEDAGRYKINQNYIIEEDKLGNRKMRFKPLDAKETPEAMKQLILAYQDARNNSNINQLLLIPCVILDFLCIHPFRDGNGRMSRLLTLLLLYKNGFDVGKYVSFEEQINNSKGNYYEALRLSSINWLENKHSYIPFIENFLSTLYICYKELDKRFSVVNSNKITKKARIEATILNNLTPISKSEICSILPDVSATTVEVVLASMVKDGTIIKIGNGRNTKYIKNNV